MRPGIARWTVAFALLAWATGAAADGTGPALWSVAGDRNTVYLFGSVHLLRDGEFRLDGMLSDAYEDAEAVYFEVDMDDLDPVQAAAATAALAIDPQGRGLIELMGPQADALRERAAAADVDLAMLAPMEPWFAGLTVVTLALTREGFSAAAGVEQVVMQRVGADGKEILGFETLEEQLGALDRLDPALQRDFLLKALDDVTRSSEVLGGFLEAWKAGDEKALAEELASEFQPSPALYESLMVRRNQRWAGQIEALLDDDCDYLVVVGALHLVGPDGLPSLLRDRGMTVTRH